MGINCFTGGFSHAAFFSQMFRKLLWNVTVLTFISYRTRIIDILGKKASHYKYLIDNFYKGYLNNNDNNLRKHYEQLKVSFGAFLKKQLTITLNRLRYIILVKQKSTPLFVGLLS